MADSVEKLPHPPVDVHLVDYGLALGRAYLTLARHDTTEALQRIRVAARQPLSSLRLGMDHPGAAALRLRGRTPRRPQCSTRRA